MLLFSNKLIEIVLLVSIVLSTLASCATTSKSNIENPVYGNWYTAFHYKNYSVDQDFDLVINKNNSVVFKQTIFKSPCQYTFDGRYSNDTIYHTSAYSCLNNSTQEFEFKHSHIDTFWIYSKSDTMLLLTRLTDDRQIEYRRP